MATATRSTVKTNGKPAAKKTNVRTRTVKPAPKPAAKKVATKTAPKRITREQDSVTGTFQRGKRDRVSGKILAHEPKSGGGVRFEDTQDRGFSPVYLSQSDDALLGKPQQIRVTIKAL